MRSLFCLIALLLCLGGFCPAGLAAKKRSGLDIYRADCARCHGPKGEGVADKHDEPLYGDRSVAALARLITRTMPEDAHQKTPPEDATKVAAYIYDAFYSPAARARNQPPRLQLSRLTVRQYQNAIADLLGSFRQGERLTNERGLRGEYYNARNFREDKKALTRVDPRLEFNFAGASPDPDTNKIGVAEFSMRWRGSVIAEDTGVYEFALKSENGARLWVNSPGRVARGVESPLLIDAWVSSGGQVREERATILLLGGRAYPIQVDFFKFNEKGASVTLRWKPPHKGWATVPEEQLAPVRVPETMVVATAFPADDSSLGYERGTSVSKAWDQATTYAAIDTANQVLEQLDGLSGVKADATNRVEAVKRFCEEFAERAFRRPLTAEQKQLFIEKQFASTADVEGAVKRVVLLVLKSPRFLYLDLESAAPDDYDVASRLSFGLWDSLPDPELFAAARAEALRTREQITAEAQRLLPDPRAKMKVREFFHHWLEMDEAEDISKDAATFPDFTEAVLSDLRTSLELFIDEVVWSGGSDYRQLLLADYLFLNDRLAKLYGADVAPGSGFAKVAFNPKLRTGLITHPYLLSIFAYHKNSSPIHRGVFLTRNIVGRALKPPPMAIIFMDGRFDPSLTMREKVAELTRPAACQTCHSVINPLGFSLEHYDAVGRYRTVDNRKQVNASGVYPTSDGKTVRLRGARDIAEYAVKNRESHLAFIQQLFHHVVKQPAGAYGAETLENLRRSFVKSEFNIQKLVVEMVRISAAHGMDERRAAGARKLALEDHEKGGSSEPRPTRQIMNLEDSRGTSNSRL